MKYIHIEILSQFFKYYRKLFIDSIAVTLILSLGIGVLQSQGYFYPSLWYLSTLPILVYLLAAISLFTTKLILISGSYRGLIIKSIVGQWTITSKRGNISSDFIYELTNASNVPVIEFVPDREGFHADVDYSPNYKTLSSTKNVVLRSIKEYDTELAFHSQMIHTTQYEANIAFHPPVAPSETIQLLRQYDVEESELAAFTDQGTFFGIRIFCPTNRIILRLYAPPHYFIEIINFFIGNENGEMLEVEKKRQLVPSLGLDKRVIEWRILYPRHHYRYWVNYRIREIE